MLQIAVAERAVILTHDADFGELVFRFGLRSNGVVLLRLFGLPLSVKTGKGVSCRATNSG
ncbi:MAG: DUF5615 family PIN-like protein [Acidobacteria bacterium]|nr:DUF5615 family PIN-like protein [Acidobacteriota bacterium]